MWYYHFNCPHCKKEYIIDNRQNVVACLCGDGKIVILHMKRKDEADLSLGQINLFPSKELIQIEPQEILKLWKIKFNTDSKEYKDFIKMDSSKEYKDYAKERSV